MQRRVIYVVGYGRSGSTLLSVMLDSVPTVAAVGELAGLPKFTAAGAPVCSCGRPYEDCPVWGPVLRRLDGGKATLEELRGVRRKMETWWGPWFRWGAGDLRDRYREITSELLAAVFEVTGAEVIVDASKSAFSTMWRGQVLAGIPGTDVFVIHLVRNPSRVMTSCRKGRNVDLERGRVGRAGLFGATVGLAGWCVANHAARRIRDTYPSDRSIVVRFEDLVESPSNELRRICDLAGLDCGAAPPTHRAGVTFDVGHLVGANRVARNHDTITVREEPAREGRGGYFEKIVAATVEPVLLRWVASD